MILVDTSVVIDFARGKEPKLAALLMAHPVAVCGVTRAEFLCGARDPAHRHKLITILAAFSFVPFPDAIWDEVGDNVAILRRRGITVPFPDALIATVAISNDVEVWTPRSALCDHSRRTTGSEVVSRASISSHNFSQSPFSASRANTSV